MLTSEERKAYIDAVMKPVKARMHEFIARQNRSYGQTKRRERERAGRGRG